MCPPVPQVFPSLSLPPLILPLRVCSDSEAASMLPASGLCPCHLDLKGNPSTSNLQASEAELFTPEPGLWSPVPKALLIFLVHAVSSFSCFWKYLLMGFSHQGLPAPSIQVGISAFFPPLPREQSIGVVHHSCFQTLSKSPCHFWRHFWHWHHLTCLCKLERLVRPRVWEQGAWGQDGALDVLLEWGQCCFWVKLYLMSSLSPPPGLCAAEPVQAAE